ncbi:MAG: hypothetical protein IT353_17170 [Gemmatimonadaceae bacterium]|nr:hypothetical protein [Gemmatimonadaceae bacterium]
MKTKDLLVQLVPFVAFFAVQIPAIFLAPKPKQWTGRSGTDAERATPEGRKYLRQTRWFLAGSFAAFFLSLFVITRFYELPPR